MRAIKQFMRNRKAEMLWCGPCECRTLQCWREAQCNCEETDNTFKMIGYTFTMPWTKKTWTMSKGSWYVSFTDGETGFHFINNWSAIRPWMQDDLLIEDVDTYHTMLAFTETVDDNIRAEGAEAETIVPDEIKALIVDNFQTMKAQQVYFDWDGVKVWNNDNRFPIYNVVDYDGKVLWEQWMLETWGKFAYLEWNDWDTYGDIIIALLQQGAGKIKIDYNFSAVIREGFTLNSRPSKWGLAEDGYACYVPTVNNYMYKLSFNNDGILQLILAEAGQGIPGVDAWTVVTLSNEAEDYIAHNREGWIYLDAIGDEKVLGELAA